MPHRPLILFPSPERADREQKKPGFVKIVTPSFGRQFTRLQPAFNVLRTAFEQKALKIQQSSVDIRIYEQSPRKIENTTFEIGFLTKHSWCYIGGILILILRLFKVLCMNGS